MIPFSDEELLKPVTASLQKVLPMLENDGGGMELLGIKNGKIYLAFGSFHLAEAFLKEYYASKGL